MPTPLQQNRSRRYLHRLAREADALRAYAARVEAAAQGQTMTPEQAVAYALEEHGGG